MGRPPIGKKAMSAAERQKRHRKKQKREFSALAKKAAQQKARLEAAKHDKPMPPGFHVWRRRTVNTPDGETDIWVSDERPFASTDLSLVENIDLGVLGALLQAEATKRGLQLNDLVEAARAENKRRLASLPVPGHATTVTIGPAI